MRDYFIVLLLIFIVIISCNDDSKVYSIGDEFIDVNTRVIQIDTLTLKTSTIILDSLVTSSTNRILLGALQDEIFGRLISKSYFEVIGSSYEIDDSAIYDSIGLILHYDSYYYGDTTQVQTYKIHKITEDFKPEEEDYFYNTSSLNFESDVLGELSFKPYPIKEDSLYIPLKNEFGEKLFNDIINNNINNDDDLLKTIKGITIIPDSISNNILGFNFSTISGSSDNTVVRLFYTKNDDDNEDNDYYKDFYISLASQQFNQINSDKTSTLLNYINSGEDIYPTQKTNNTAYIQSGTGVCMRVDIPALINLNKLENDGTNLNASLKMYPVKNSYGEKTSLVDSLAIYVFDHKNRMIEQLTDYGGNYVFAELNTINNEFNDSDYYTANISLFVEQVLMGTYNTNYGLVFLLPDYDKSVNKLLVHDSNNSETKMELSIIYLTY